MKIFRNYLAFILTILALSFTPGTAQSLTPSGSTRTIEDKVRKTILKIPQYEVFDWITFRVSGDTVTLSGKVRNAINKSDAANRVKRIAGVSRVINEIEVLPLGSFDESTRVRLYQTLSRSGGLSRYLWTVNPPVRLIVDRGHVSLEGFVSNRGDYNAMNALAHGVSGVFSVTNNLMIDSERVR